MTSDKQAQIAFAARWLLEFGPGPSDRDSWFANEWYREQARDHPGNYIGAWETRGWLTEIDARTTIISQASLDLLKGEDTDNCTCP